MKNNRYTKIIPLCLGVALLSLIAGAVILAWTEPTVVSPGGNVPTPLNVGPVGQSKIGGLILNTGGAGTGLIVQYGNVGIGTATPGDRLDVQGGGIIVNNPTNEGGRIRIMNTLKTGATTRDWSLWNMTGPYGNGLSFWRYFADGTNAGPSFWLADNGNVGIGTTAPQSALHVAGYVQFATRFGAPPVADCAAATRGRTIVDTGAQALWMCMDTGWTSLILAPVRTLAITISGTGTVSGTGPGVSFSCTTNCNQTIAHGTTVTLTATPGTHWAFAGWGGACAGTDTCTVTMTENRSVTATFGQEKFLYYTATSHTGNLGGRSGANSICAGDANRPVPCATRWWAFISVSDTDEIRDFPTTIPGFMTAIPWHTHWGGTKRLIDNNWASLLDGTILTTIGGGRPAVNYHTGSWPDGTFDAAFSCGGYTFSGHGGRGMLGNSSFTHLAWLQGGNSTCNHAFRILCACM